MTAKAIRELIRSKGKVECINVAESGLLCKLIKIEKLIKERVNESDGSKMSNIWRTVFECVPTKYIGMEGSNLPLGH